MIKAVIFDFGNVISLPHQELKQWAEERGKKTGVDSNVFLEVFTNRRQELDLGTVTGSVFYSKILKDLGYDELSQNTELTTSLAFMDFADWNNYNQAVTEWGLLLQKTGFKIGILSNMPREFLTLYKQNIPLFAKADFSLFSCDVGLVKPDPKIYEKCLENTGLKPEEVVFFDDMTVNVEAAKNQGWNAFVFTDLEQAKKDLASLF